MVSSGHESKTESKTTLLLSFLPDNHRQLYHSNRLQKPLDPLDKPIQKAYQGSSSPPFGISKHLKPVLKQLETFFDER
jgi:hypothetical protein